MQRYQVKSSLLCCVTRMA